MIPLTAQEVGDALGTAPLSATVTAISIDTRSLEPGDLFVALRGERFDGHDFVEAAFAAGASGAVVEEATWRTRRRDAGEQRSGLADGQGRPIYVVADTLAALGALGRAVRRKSGATVFAVTGSAGKTSTKDLLGAMVAQVRRVAMTPANQNNEVGVPLTLLAIEPDTEAVIVEMGMRGHGQIAALARIAEPDVGIITNIHPVHLELLGSMEGIAEAKAELLDGLKPGGVAVVPADCELLQPYIERSGRRTVRFGVDDKECGASVRGSLETGPEGDKGVLSLVWPEGEAKVETGYMPWHCMVNAVSAAAACYAAGLPVEVCAAGIHGAKSSGGRGEVVRLPGLCMIDDTYNANPAAVRAALDELVRLSRENRGRAVAILGDMLELGSEAERYHAEVGEYAAASGIPVLWGVGPLSRATVDGFERRWAEQGGPAGSEWVAGHVGSAEETSSVVACLRPGDVVLLKASRSVRLETMVRRITAEAGTWNEETR